MRKNYFMKNMLAASMLLAVSLGMSSCSGFIDAVIGTSDQPTTTESTTEPTTDPTTEPTTPTTSNAVVTADQTTITIASLDDMDKAISAEQNEEFVKAIEAKAAAGEEYTINIKSEKPLSTEDFEGLEIPRVEDAKINLVIEKPLVTSETSPLKISADEKKSDIPTTAVNELTITLPDGSDNVYLSVNMPETTVKLEGNVTYQFVEAITAINNTLVVGGGVTIREYKISEASLQYTIGGGLAVVKDGGSIETLVYPAGIFYMGITYKGLLYAVTPDLAFYIVIAKDEKGNPYFFPNLKVVKGDADFCGLIHACHNLPVDCDVEKWLKYLIIGDGAVVRNMNYTVVPYENIIGEGKATFLYGYNMQEIGFNDQDMKDLIFSTVQSISNVAFKPKYADGTVISNIPNNTTGSLFEANQIHLIDNKYELSAYKATSNVYNFTDLFDILIPGQPNGIAKFECKFGNCKFSNNAKLTVELTESKPAYNADGTPKMVWYYYDTTSGLYNVVSDYYMIPTAYLGSEYKAQDFEPIVFSSYKGTVEFNNCKYGPDDISKSTKFLKKGYFTDSNIDLKFVIDGTSYDYTYDPTSFEITL